MDYDHPHRNRPRLGPQLCLLLALAASVTLLWVVGNAVSHFQLLNQAGGAVPGTVVGYEFVGGRPRLGVRVEPAGQPTYFVRADAAASGPGYTAGQHVQVLTWRTVNPLGQELVERVVYDGPTYWRRPLLVGALSLAALVGGLAGWSRRHGRRPPDPTIPPPLPASR